MEIKNISSTPKFTGIYKFPNVDAKMLDNISEHMAFFSCVTKSPVYLFSGKHPLENKVVEVITETVPECKRYSYAWLVQNAKNHGITLPDARTSDAWIFTNKDIYLIRDCCEKFDKVLKGEESFFDVLKKLFFVPDKPKRVLPRHLREIEDIAEKNNAMIDVFEKSIADKKVVEVNSLTSLIYSVSTKP
jgi:hypothetical protein